MHFFLYLCTEFVYVRVYALQIAEFNIRKINKNKYNYGK